jgi:hypothetical protein
MDNLTTATPVEVDTTLAALHGDLMAAGQKVEYAIDRLHRAAGDKTSGYGRDKRWGMTSLVALSKARDLAEEDPSYIGRQAQEAIANLDAANLAYSSIREEMATLDAEWIRRGRWTRAFLVVTSGKGHVHKDMHCSTCFDTTQYAWLPELSGHDQDEIIVKAGSDACTICYPDAPVEALSRPRSVFTGEEISAQEAREQAAQAKVARLAKKIEKGLTDDGSEFLVTYPSFTDASREDRQWFKTEQAAVQWVVQYVCWDGKDSNKRPAFDQIVAAVAVKHTKTVEDVWAEIDAKVIAKNKRDSRY